MLAGRDVAALNAGVWPGRQQTRSWARAELASRGPVTVWERLESNPSVLTDDYGAHTQYIPHGRTVAQCADSPAPSRRRIWQSRQSGRDLKLRSAKVYKTAWISWALSPPSLFSSPHHRGAPIHRCPSHHAVLIVSPGNFATLRFERPLFFTLSLCAHSALIFHIPRCARLDAYTRLQSLTSHPSTDYRHARCNCSIQPFFNSFPRRSQGCHELPSRHRRSLRR